MLAKKNNSVHKNSFLNCLAGINKNRRKSASSRKQRRLTMEGLEQRQVFSVTSLATTHISNDWFNGNMLVVKTDDAATQVVVSQVGTKLRVNDVTAGKHWDYNLGQFQGVTINGGNGDDYFVDNAAVQLLAFGGRGNDYIVGGNLNDHLYGNDGNDVLLGERGNDLLSGDAGNDRLNGEAGDDKLLGGDGNDALISIDNAYNDYLDGGRNGDAYWVDKGTARVRFPVIGTLNVPASDTLAGLDSADAIHGVDSFTNPADHSLDGDNIADPRDIGPKLRYNNNITAGNTLGTHPLFGKNGPTDDDINQGAIGDCWLLAGLSSVARQSPASIWENMVDFDDGTYGVSLGNKVYRVDNELPVNSTSSPADDYNTRDAGIGSNGSTWVAVVEKAFADYRTGSNTYSSLNGGDAKELYQALHGKNVSGSTLRAFGSAKEMAESLNAKWNRGYSITIGGIGHEFAVVSFARDAAGNITSIKLRNPWAVDGLSSFPAFSKLSSDRNPNDGYFTVTPTQLFSAATSVSPNMSAYWSLV